VQMATEAGQIRHLIDAAMRIAISERTVTCVIIPDDVQMQDAEIAPLPESITLEQARSFVSAIRHGAPAGRRIMAQAIRQTLPEPLPGG